MIRIERLNIVEVIELACKELKVTQRAIYDEAGISHTNHARWKTDGVSPNSSTQNKIIDAIERLQKRKQRARK